MKFKLFILFSLFLSCSLANAGLYRWVDENGKVHYSDSVPPEKSQRGHAELNEHGLQVDQVSAAKSEEVVAEENWLAELEEQLVVKSKQQARKDAMLLNSYPTLEQFDSLSAERFSVLSDERKQLELLRGKLLEEFERLEKQLKTSKSGGEKKRIREFIATNVSNTEAYDRAIRQNDKEVRALKLSNKEQRKRLVFLLDNMEAEAAKAE